MVKKEDLTAVILAGGKSSRMGQDKAFLLYDNLTFLEQIIKATAGLVHETIVVSDNKNFEKFGLTVVADLIKNQGPIGGIYTAMNVVETPYLLVLSCDIPLIKNNLLAYLLEQSKEVDLNIISLKQQLQPLTAIYKKSTQPLFEKALKNQDLKLRLLFEKMSVNTINCPLKLEQQLTNINTPEEFEKMQNEIRN